jgi:CubicO group peptidase (beta-lactamase class C family)
MMNCYKMRIRRHRIVFLLLALLVRFVAADPSAQVDALFEALSAKKAPGLAVLVARDGKALLKKGYGYEDLQRGIPITADTVFDLASASKQFTAMGILILQQRGKLQIDDPITKFITGFPPYAREITIRNLLNHTSGLQDYQELFQKSGKIDTNYPRTPPSKPTGWEPTTRDALKLLVQQDHLLFSPGVSWSYSDSGYVVLAEVIERVSGMRYGDFLKKNIFDVLGMDHTVVYDERKPKIPNRAVSYEEWLGFYRDIDYTPLNNIYGDGNVNSTVSDLFLWDQALYTDRLIPQPVLQHAFRPTTLKDKNQIHYGFGWYLGTYGPFATEYHPGSWLGFQSMILRIPDRHFSVIALANCTCLDLQAQVQKIIEFYLVH